MSNISKDAPTSGQACVSLGLDHVGLGIRDLSIAVAAFKDLGFTLSPLSMHAGALTPGGPTVPWGSGNRCAMFRRGYFELLGLVDHSLPSNLKATLERYEGLHIVALDCATADSAHARLVGAGVSANRPVALERDATFGSADESVRRAKFRNVNLNSEAHPEARFIVIEHQTRDVLWQEHLLDHPNGAEALEAVCLVVQDLQASRQRLQPLLGSPFERDGSLRFELERGAVWMMEGATFRRLCPVLRDGPIHRVAAACFAVRSLERLELFLTERRIAFVADAAWDNGEPCIWVGPSEAAGAAIQFIQSSSTTEQSR